MEKIKQWLKKLVVGKKYKEVIKEYGSERDWEEINNIEGFLKDCKVRITDYSNCEGIPTTLGLRIKYGNKEFFFNEKRNFELDMGVRQYDMEYDGSGMAVSESNNK